VSAVDVHPAQPATVLQVFAERYDNMSFCCVQCEEKLRSKADSGSPVAWVFNKVRHISL
jgi:hypothetical protein